MQIESHEFGKLRLAFGQDFAEAAAKSGKAFATIVLDELIRLASLPAPAGTSTPIATAHAALVKAGKAPAEAWAELRRDRPVDVAQYHLSGGHADGTSRPPPSVAVTSTPPPTPQTTIDLHLVLADKIATVFNSKMAKQAATRKAAGLPVAVPARGPMLACASAPAGRPRFSIKCGNGGVIEPALHGPDDPLHAIFAKHPDIG